MRSTIAAVTTAVVLAALVAVGTPAGAQYTTIVDEQECADLLGPGFAFGFDEETPEPGATITLSGRSIQLPQPFDFSLVWPTGTFATETNPTLTDLDGDGDPDDFDRTFVAPDASGVYSVNLVAQLDDGPEVCAVADFEVVEVAATTASTTSTTSTDTTERATTTVQGATALPFTGANSSTVAGIAAILLVAGGLVLLASRRRHAGA
jgi:LPXTG-motif cell wall-anchored protein